MCAKFTILTPGKTLRMYILNFILLGNAEKNILHRIAETVLKPLYLGIPQGRDHRRLLWKRYWTFVLYYTTTKLLEQLSDLELVQHDRSDQFSSSWARLILCFVFRKCRYMKPVSIAAETADLNSRANVCDRWQLISRDTCYQR
jgi:hypothetical protein